MRIAAILTGGQSQRMGEDKAVLDLGGERLIDRVVARLGPQVDQVCLVGSQDYGTGLPVLADDERFAGPLAGIFGMAGWLRESHPDTAGFVTAPVDAPLCPPDLWQKLSQAEGSAIAADPKRVHPIFACWRVDELEAVADRLVSNGSLHSLAEQVGAWPVRWASAEPFTNLNTPDEVRAFLASGWATRQATA